MATRKRGRSEGGATDGPVTRSKALRLRSGLTLAQPTPERRQAATTTPAAPAASSAPLPPASATGSTRAASRKQVATHARKGRSLMESTSDGSGPAEDKIKPKGGDKKRDKGKEKEQEAGGGREMDRATRRGGAPLQEEGGVAAGGAAVGTGGASSALQGLLRKLGSSLDDLMLSGTPALSSSRLKSILAGLRAEGEEGRQLEALSALCELLSIGTEDSLSSFSVDAFVPLLVNLLNCEYNSDIMLLAARALTHLTDVLPNACQSVVHYGAVPAFCARLLTIEYIDLAEQSLQALEKISYEHPAAVLRAGGLLAVLSYLDFFSTGVQRVALSTAANICRQLPSDATELITDAIPILTNLLQYQDEKVVEHACMCLSRIAENWALSSHKLDLLCSHGLISQAARLIAVPASATGPQAVLSVATYTGVVRLLSTCAAGSPAVVEALLEQGIIAILHDILAGAATGPAPGGPPPALTRSPEQLYELMSLVSELLPPVVDPSAAAPAAAPPDVGNRAARRKAAQEAGGPMSEVKVEPNGEGGGNPREQWLAAHPGVVEQYGRDLFPVLLQVYGSSVNPAVRSKCLVAINKYLHFVRPDTLQGLLKDSNIAGFLASVLVSKDATVLNTALQIAEGLMAKLPNMFRRLFVKEGVLHALEALVASEPALASSATPEAAGPSAAGETGAGPSAGPGPRPKRGSAKQRRKEEDGEGEGATTSGSIPTGGGGGEAGGPDSLARAFTHLGSGRPGLRLVAAVRARRLKETYFADGESENDDAARLSRLKELCAQIGGGQPKKEKAPKKTGKHKGKKGKEKAGEGGEQVSDTQVLKEVLGLLLEGDGVSTFEFVGSGIAPALLKLLTRGGGAGGKHKELPPTARQQEHVQTLARLQPVVELLLPPSATSPDETPLTVLVRKLQAALTSLERFPVMLSQAPTGSRTLGARAGGGVAGGLSALTQPFKLRLSRAPGENVLRDYSSNVVLIEPLATLAAVEDFLWHRVRARSDASAATNGASSSAGATAQLEAALAAAAAQFAAANGRAGTMEKAAADTTAAGAAGARPLTRAQKREADTAAAAKSGKGAVGKGGAEEKGGGEEVRVTRAAARRRAEAAGQAGPHESQGTDGKGPKEEHEHDLDSEEEAELQGMEYEAGLTMMEEDEDMSEEEEVYGEEALPIPESVHDVQLGSEAADAAPSIAPPSRAVAASLPPHHPSSLRSLADARSDAASFAAAVAGARARACEDGGSPKLQFLMGRRVLDRHMTIFQAIQAQAQAAEEDAEEDDSREAEIMVASSGRRLWDAVYTISYASAPQEGAAPSANGSSGSSGGSSAAVGAAEVGSPLEVVRAPWLTEEVAPSRRPVREILELLRLLEAVSQLVPRMRADAAVGAVAEGRHATLQEALGAQQGWPMIRPEEFLSAKITPKLTRQMQDALALCSGGLPPWVHHLTAACPFLFPFEARRQYFFATAFGLSRALQRLQQQQSVDGTPVAVDREGREVRVGRLQRQKVRVSRQRILESAAKVFELYAGHKAVLEVEYFGEVGTGLGPTLEFYTLLSHELQKKQLHLWRGDAPAPEPLKDVDPTLETDADLMDLDDITTPDVTAEAVPSVLAEAQAGSPEVCVESAFVHAPHGLFPRPLAPSALAAERTRVGDHFRLLGRAMAKALQDGRMLDLPLAPAFYKRALGQDLDRHDLAALDPALGRQLDQLHLIICRKKHADVTRGASGGSELLLGGASIEDLCLDFTLPGYPEYELKQGGADCSVTLDNLEDYVHLLLRATLDIGVEAQVDAFRTGFNQVFPLSSLRLFTPDELEALLCGKRELWTPESLAEHIKFDHGYTAGSPPIQHLLTIMGDFTPEEQRSFLRFVTGAPRLPPGGLSALTPRLTIVRKHPSGGAGAASLGSTPPGSTLAPGTTLADGDLPSVMTCANYLKLPPYSCKAVMKDRLLYAIKEGQGSFDLS